MQELTSGGAIDSSTTGLKELAVSQTFAARIVYWWAIVPIGGTVTFRSVTPSWPPYPTSQAEATNPAGRYGHEWATTTLPVDLGGVVVRRRRHPFDLRKGGVTAGP
ncbi:hypothetical protein [Kineosporia sp. R_H_3]|uniref:hypothetical protein n=1 Tax=Kineosporia sp. R_H_3 TaxID=1961848 RepID=UPI000B4AE462|nr:hypothetical protein [Kineosporia sp. R_H_3]